MNAKAIAAWVIGSGVGVAILGFAMQFWISLVVASQLADAGIIPATEWVEEKGKIKANTEDIIRVESKAERIAQILMED